MPPNGGPVNGQQMPYQPMQQQQPGQQQYAQNPQNGGYQPGPQGAGGPGQQPGAGLNNQLQPGQHNQFPGQQLDSQEPSPLQASMSHELIAENNMAQVDHNGMPMKHNQFNMQQQQQNYQQNNFQNQNGTGNSAQPPSAIGMLHPQQLNNHPGQSTPPPPPPTSYMGAPQSPSTPITSSQSQNVSLAIGGKCAHIGCRCKTYTESASKWSKGKCKSCNHTEAEHKIAASAAFGFDQNKAAKAPILSNNKKLPPKPIPNKPANMMYQAPKGLPPNKPQPSPSPGPPNMQPSQSVNVNE